MTRPLKYLYKIQYEDHTHQYVDWTKKEYEQAGEAIADNKYALVLADGIFALRNVRAIVYIPPVPEEETKKDEKEEKIREWDFTGDPEVYDDLKALGLLDTGGDR